MKCTDTPSHLECCLLGSSCEVSLFVKSCIRVTDGTRPSLLSKSELWFRETELHIYVAFARNEERWKPEGAIQNSHLTTEIWSVTLMHYQAKYLLPGSDVYFSLPLIHDKKTRNYFFSKVLSSDYFILTCNYPEIMYKGSSSSIWKGNKANNYFLHFNNLLSTTKVMIVSPEGFFFFGLIFKPAVSHLSSQLLSFSWRKRWQNEEVGDSIGWNQSSSFPALKWNLKLGFQSAVSPFNVCIWTWTLPEISSKRIRRALSPRQQLAS